MLVDASINASFRTAVRYPYIQFIKVVLHFFGAAYLERGLLAAVPVGRENN